MGNPVQSWFLPYWQRSPLCWLLQRQTPELRQAPPFSQAGSQTADKNIVIILGNYLPYRVSHNVRSFEVYARLAR